MYKGGPKSLSCILSSAERKQLFQRPLKSHSANPHTTLTPGVENPLLAVVQGCPGDNTV